MAVDLSKLTDQQLLDIRGGRLDRLPDDVLMSMRNVKPSEVPQFEKDALAIKNTKAEDLVFGSAPGRFVSGVADPFVGGLQLGSRLLPGDAASNYMDRVVKEREKSTRRGDVAYGREGFDWMRLMGNVGNPLGLKAGTMMPATTSGKIATGSGIGTGFGLTAPVENTEEYAKTKGLQTLFGATAGAAIPALTAFGKWSPKVIKHLLEPLSDKGHRAIRSREYLAAAGDKADDIVGLLDDNRQFVAGSRPTAAEAAAPAGRAEFSAMQRAASAHRPSDYLARANQQQAARQASLGTVAKTPTDLKAAEVLRSTAGARNYGAAYAKQIGGDDELVAIAQSPYFDVAYRDALKIAKTDGINPTSVHFLHLVKRGFDKQLGKNLAKPLGAEERRSVTGLQKRLIDWIEKRVPEYRAARLQYADDSLPINRMRVGQELEKTLSPPVKDIAEVGKQRLGPFAASIRDSSGIIKKSGGDPRFGALKDILSPSEMKRVNNIASDLARRAQYEEQAIAGMNAQKGNIVAAQLQRETGASTAPNALYRPIMILNAVLKRIQGKAGQEVEEEIALEMLDPKLVLSVMKKALISKKRIDKVMKLFDAIPVKQPSAIAGAVLQGSSSADDISGGNLIFPH